MLLPNIVQAFASWFSPLRYAMKLVSGAFSAATAASAVSPMPRRRGFVRQLRQPMPAIFRAV